MKKGIENKNINIHKTTNQLNKKNVFGVLEEPPPPECFLPIKTACFPS